MDPGRTQTNCPHRSPCSRTAGGYHVSTARAFLSPSRAARAKVASSGISGPGRFSALSHRRQTGALLTRTLGFMNSVLDDALERLRGMGPEARHGAPNHGPMAAEALVALGCLDEVPRWVDDYRGELDPMPPARSPVTEGNWHEAFGAIHRGGDWQAFFVARVGGGPWEAGLGRGRPRLVQ